MTRRQRTANRYAGRKRNKPDSDDERKDDENDDITILSVNNNINNNNRNRSTRAPKRRKISYKLDKQKWNKNQNNTQRRDVRIKQRKLADDVQENRVNIVDPMSGLFIDKLDQQQKLYQQVSHPNEAFMDIQQANVMANILKEQTKTLQNEQFEITPNDLIASVKQQFSLNNNDQSDNDDIDDDAKDDILNIDWAAFGRSMAPYFLSIAPIQMMSGPLQQCENPIEIKKKKREYRRKIVKQSKAPVIQPKMIKEQEKSEKTSTTCRIKQLKKTFRSMCSQNQNIGVNPFSFLVNPKSYSQTVENIFDMSFIMNQGYAQMHVSNNSQQPVLSFISASERTKRFEKAKDTKTNGQCIVAFNPNTFSKLINVYNITESQIEREDDDDDEKYVNGEESASDTESESGDDEYGPSNDKDEAD